MSCLNLRLPPAKKAWRSFTSKLQGKLHKLHKSKAIKKPKHQHHLKTTSSKPIQNPPVVFTTASSKLTRKPPVPFKKRDRYKGRLVYPSSSRTRSPFKRSSRLRFNKISAPVYIDTLFEEPVTLMKSPPGEKNTKKLIDHQAATSSVGTSAAAGRAAEKACPDDIWESLTFASPQMRGIDERAEQFILKFREEMEIQEMIARGL